VNKSKATLLEPRIDAVRELGRSRAVQISNSVSTVLLELVPRVRSNLSVQNLQVYMCFGVAKTFGPPLAGRADKSFREFPPSGNGLAIAQWTSINGCGKCIASSQRKMADLGIHAMAAFR